MRRIVDFYLSGIFCPVVGPDPHVCMWPVPADEKERFDPTQFQESIVQGLNETGTDLEAVAKFLDTSGAKLDYRRYAETLFDILVAGGMLGEWLRCFTAPLRSFIKASLSRKLLVSKCSSVRFSPRRDSI